MISILLIGAGIGIVVSVFANLSATIYLHRALSHRALTAGGPDGVRVSSRGVRLNHLVFASTKRPAATAA